ncbi:MAG: hypothetical protein AB8V06_05515 [Francisella endosymbiont of Hyalomma asiaticum]
MKIERKINQNKTDISYGKDSDARWIKKGKRSHYSYKVFASVDEQARIYSNCLYRISISL